MKYILLVSFFLQLILWAGWGAADTVALLPLHYVETGTRESGIDCAPCRNRVLREIAEGLVDKGHEMLDADTVEEALSGTDVMLRECRDQAALEALASMLADEADRVVCVWVRDETKISATYEIRVTAVPGATSEKTDIGGLVKIASSARKMVLETLSRKVDRGTETAPVDPPHGETGIAKEEPFAPEPVSPGERGSSEATVQETQPAPEEEEAEGSGDAAQEPQPGPEEEAEVATAVSEMPVKRKFGRAPFWVSLAVTGGLAIGYVVTELVASSMYDDLRREDDLQQWLKLRDDFKAVQTADRVLLGMVAAGAATTVVLGVLTDFRDDSSKDREELGLRLAVAVSGEGAGVLIRKSF